MALDHHANVEHLDVVLDGVGLAVVDSALRLERLGARGLDADRVLCEVFSRHQIGRVQRRVDHAVVVHD